MSVDFCPRRMLCDLNVIVAEEGEWRHQDYHVKATCAIERVKTRLRATRKGQRLF